MDVMNESTLFPRFVGVYCAVAQNFFFSEMHVRNEEGRRREDHASFYLRCNGRITESDTESSVSTVSVAEQATRKLLHLRNCGIGLQNKESHLGECKQRKMCSVEQKT